MGLINCPACNNPVSEAAVTCPHCGHPLKVKPEPIYATICIQRESKKLYFAAAYEVYLDSRCLGTLKNGNSVYASVPIGGHHLKIIDIGNRSTAYDNQINLTKNGLTISFVAAIKIKPTLKEGVEVGEHPVQRFNTESETTSSPQARKCPKCGGPMSIQTISESRKAGCGTILFYIFLFISVLGWLVLVPLLLRKKTENTTYAICQACGFKQKL